MVDYKQDLWPDEINSIEVVSPVTIVKEQGKILGKKTNNIIIGEVRQSKIPEDIYIEMAYQHLVFYYKFFLVCSTLNYKYELFSFGLPIDMYPVEIFPDSSITREFIHLNINRATSEETFINILKKIFSAQKTVKIISTLLSQSQDIKD